MRPGDLMPHGAPPAPVRIEYHLAGLDCPNEGKLVEAALSDIAGIADLQINYVKGTVTVLAESATEPTMIQSRLASTGMTATRLDDAAAATAGPDTVRPHHIGPAVAMCAAAVFALIGSVVTVTAWSSAAPFLYALAVVIGGVPTAVRAVRSLRVRAIDMHVLMTIAVIGAAAIGEWMEASVVVVLFALANSLEAMSLARARRAIDSLLDLTPPRATVRDGGDLTIVPVDQVAVGDVVLVKAGERIPVDGIVVAGRSDVDQSPVTGEARSIGRTVGDHVYAGSLTVDGSLDIEATHPASDSTPARIRHMVEQAEATRAPIQRFADRFAERYTPAVLALAALVALLPPVLLGGGWSTWVYRALVLLVIACPCALVISTPVALVSHLAAAARAGILIKGGVHLENLARVCSVVFDKTGTLTVGRPRVVHTVALNGATEADVLRQAAAVEACASHPLAPVICAAAREAGLTIPEATAPHTHPGQGLHATLEGRDVWVGTLAMARGDGPLLAAAADVVREHEAHGETTVVVGSGAEPFGVLGLADEARPEAAETVAALRAAGLHHLYMLTGDNRAVADELQRDLGLDGAFAELLPEDKVVAVQRLLDEEHRVAMVGDGINDAPALATATVGIAMGAGATDVALETADVALIGDDLRALPTAIALARSSMRIIRQNIAVALGLKAVVFVLALAGIATLWLAILADMGASLLVIANALRPLARGPKAVTTGHPR